MTGLDRDDAADLGIYLYCLARPECLALVQGSAESALYGVDERYPVTTLALDQPEDGVVAVIGQVDPAEFSDQNLQALDWLGPRAQRHEAVVERIMDVSPVLPVKFGTMFRSQASLKQFLDRHHKDIEQALDKLRDKAEWSVKGYLAEEDTRTIIAAEDAEVQSRRAALSPSPGLRYLQQKQLDAVIEAALRAWVARITHDLHDVLVRHADASAALRCHASAVTGRAERMVFNGSFLLTPAALTDFRAALSGLQQAHQRTGLALELRGPWPPYNFCPTLV